MEESSQRDLFFPILGSEALMGPLLLVARLFTTVIFGFYVVSEVSNARSPFGLVYVVIAVQLVGLVLIALGYNTRFTALFMAACVCATLRFRANAGLTTGFEVAMLKDLAIAAGFLFMFAHGPGPLSIDGYRSRSNIGIIEPRFYPCFFDLVVRNNLVMGPLLFLGRILSTLVFFVYGTHKILNTPGTRAYMMQHNSHVPTDLVYLAIVTQFIFPVLVLLGFKTRYGALALSGFCIIATSLFHSDFGNHAEVEQFMLDFAIAGGFLFMFAHGPGPLSLDVWRGRAKLRARTKLIVEKGDVSLAR